MLLQRPLPLETVVTSHAGLDALWLLASLRLLPQTYYRQSVCKEGRTRVLRISGTGATSEGSEVIMGVVAVVVRAGSLADKSDACR